MLDQNFQTSDTNGNRLAEGDGRMLSISNMWYSVLNCLIKHFENGQQVWISVSQNIAY